MGNSCESSPGRRYNRRMRHLLPEFIRENLQAGRFRGEFAAATLFIDLSGYTATTGDVFTAIFPQSAQLSAFTT